MVQVIAYFGFAEAQKLAPMIFTSYQCKATDAKEAVTDLANDLFFGWWQERSYYTGKVRECCNESRKDEKTVYCSKCGAALRPIIDFDVYQDWLFSMPGLMNDDFYFEGHWDTYSLPKFDCDRFLIEESAEVILARLLTKDTLREGSNLTEVPIDLVKEYEQWYQHAGEATLRGVRKL